MALFNAEPQRIFPRQHGGIDHEVEGRILIQTQDRALIWQPGHGTWDGRGMPRRHEPGQLVVIDFNGRRGEMPTCIFSGGRLTRKRLEEHKDIICRAMRIPSASNDLLFAQFQESTVFVRLSDKDEIRAFSTRPPAKVRTGSRSQSRR